MEVGNDSYGFCGSLPMSLGKFDSIWVLVDRLTKSSHLILVRVDYHAKQMARIYVKDIVRMDVVPLSIISDCVTYLNFMFWRKLNEELDIQLTFSTVSIPRRMDNQKGLYKCWKTC